MLLASFDASNRWLEQFSCVGADSSGKKEGGLGGHQDFSQEQRCMAEITLEITRLQEGPNDYLRVSVENQSI